MKKFVVHFLGFTIFAAVVYVFLLIFWAQVLPPMLKPNIQYRMGSYGHMFSRLSEVKRVNNIDILFLGSSHAYRGFDTRIFSENGFKSFNLGSSAQTPVQTKCLLSRYIDQLNPKLVIYEVYPETFTLDGVESSFDIIASDKNDFQSLKMALKINNIKTYNTLIYGLSRDLLNSNKSYFEPSLKGEDTYVNGGFVEKKIRNYKPEIFEAKEINIIDYQIDTFTEIVRMLNDKKIELILVFAPIPQVNYVSYQNSVYFDSVMVKYATYYNFNELLTLNDSLHFYDSHHLNQDGVEIFNRELIKIITNHKFRMSKNVHRK